MNFVASTFWQLAMVAILLTPTVAESVDNLTPRLYEPNPAQPYGGPNPDAPKELAQFDFLIGTFDCADEFTDLDGNTTRVSARWSGKYILNGFGIQDSYWNPNFSTTNVRIYDDSQSKWQVTYYQLPKFKSGVWAGSMQGPDIILRRLFEYDGKSVESRLTYRKITSMSFEWTSEYITDENQYTSWISKCQRIR